MSLYSKFKSWMDESSQHKSATRSGPLLGQGTNPQAEARKFIPESVSRSFYTIAPITIVLLWVATPSGIVSFSAFAFFMMCLHFQSRK